MPRNQLSKGNGDMHLIHDIQPLMKNSLVRAVTEIAAGTRQKYEVDPEYGILSLDRTLPTACRYPANYGFIPQTLGIDGDPLDIFLFAQESIQPGTLVIVKPISVFDMITDGESDFKIIAVVDADPVYGRVKRLDEISPATLKEFEQFLLTYKQLEGKSVKLGGFQSPEDAWEVIHQSIKEYPKKK